MKRPRQAEIRNSREIRPTDRYDDISRRRTCIRVNVSSLQMSRAGLCGGIANERYTVPTSKLYFVDAKTSIRYYVFRTGKHARVPGGDLSLRNGFLFVFRTV